MTYTDPYRPVRNYYECLHCSERTVNRESVSACPACGGELRNIAVARE